MPAPPVPPKRHGGRTGTPAPRKKEVRRRHFRVDGLPEGLDDVMTSREVADALRLPLRVLADWRYRDRYLRYYKVGESVRYRAADVADFLAAHLHGDGQAATPRERETVRRHLSDAIAHIRGMSADDIAAFIVAGGLALDDAAADAAEQAMEDGLDG